jgi:hypothetical protein
MRIAVLVKQVPAIGEIALGDDGRLVRDGTGRMVRRRDIPGRRSAPGRRRPPVRLGRGLSSSSERRSDLGLPEPQETILVGHPDGKPEVTRTR